MVRDMSESLSNRGRLFNTSRATRSPAEGAGVITRSGTPPKAHAHLQFTTYDAPGTSSKHLAQSATRQQLSTTIAQHEKENIGVLTDVGSPGDALLKSHRNKLVKRREFKEKLQRELANGLDDEFYEALILCANGKIHDLELQVPATNDNARITDLDRLQRKEIREKLKVFGLKDFRPLQLEVIAACLHGRDCLVLMPTGSGKSLTYQLPGICSTGKTAGLTIVVSPLIALMKQQYEALRAMNIDVVNASLTNATTWTDNLARAHDSPMIAYVTPEKLIGTDWINDPLDALYASHRLARFVVDEAHCIPAWGRSFRNAYRLVGKHIRKRFPNVPITALTGTATDRQVLDIKHSLDLHDPLDFRLTSNRSNIFYRVCPKAKKISDAVKQVVAFIREGYEGQTGLVYCTTKKATIDVAEQLRAAGIKAKAYHGDLPTKERASAQTDWLNGVCEVIVATTAFGMGIDKSNVRFVVHFNLPRNLSDYAQETGRSGRDGLASVCLLLYHEGDFKKILNEIKRNKLLSEASKRLQQRQVNLVKQYCLNADCRRLIVLDALDERQDVPSCNMNCDNCRDMVLESVMEDNLTLEALEIVEFITAAPNTLPIDDCRLRLKQEFGTRIADGLRGGMSPSFLIDMILSQLQRKLIIECRYELGPDDWHDEYLKLGRNGQAFLNGSDPSQIIIRHHSWPIASLITPKADVVDSDSDPDNIYDSDDEEDRFDELQRSIRECPPSDKRRTDESDSEELPINRDDTLRVLSAGELNDTLQAKLFKALDDERNQVFKELGLPFEIASWPGEHPVLNDATIRELSLRCPADWRGVEQIIRTVYADSPHAKDKCVRYAQRFAALCAMWRQQCLP